MKQRDILWERGEKLIRELFSMARIMDKNVSTFTEEKFPRKIERISGEVGLHGNTTSLYTRVAIILESLDDSNVTDENVEEGLKDLYHKNNLIWGN